MKLASTHNDLNAASWGAIIAGTVTVIAVTLLLSLLTAAMGLSTVDAKSSDPLSGVGTAFGVSSAITLLLSLAAGGFVAGRLAGRTGYTHGFLTWAVSLILAVLFGIMTISGAVRMTASTAGAVASGAGSVLSASGSAVASVAGSINADLVGEIDFEKIRNDLKSTLQDTDIEALQPNRLETTLNSAREDLAYAARKLAFNPGQLPEISDELADRLNTHIDSLTSDIDRNDAVKALVENGFSQSEAEAAVDKSIRTLEEAQATISNRIDRANKMIEDGRQYLEDAEREVREQADAAAKAASRAAVWGFIAALIGALAASFAGLVGARSRADVAHVTATRPYEPQV